MQSSFASLCSRLSREVFLQKLALSPWPTHMRRRSTPTYYLIMKRWGTTDKFPGDEIDCEKIVSSKYFRTIPEIRRRNRSRASTEKAKNEVMPSVTTQIKMGEIPVIPAHKKRKRTKRPVNTVDTKESVLIQDLCGSLADVPNFVSFTNTPKLTCGLERFGSSFYDVPCIDLARNLLGQVLVRRLDDGTLLKGRIVETECYLGGEDKASHSHNGKITERNTPMYMKPGTAYVYLTYGMYHCFNISSRGPGAAVLLRALDPLGGIDFMLNRRTEARKKTPRKKEEESTSNQTKMLKPHELCNGPAKLCISFDINKLTCNKRDLSLWDGMWVEKSRDSAEVREHHVVKTQRIGIESAGVEWATKPLRFYLVDNKAVSRRDKNKEKELKEIALLLS